MYDECIRKKIDKNLDDDGKNFITTNLTDYKALVTAGAYTGTKTVDGLSLTSLDVASQAKIPSQYNDLKKTLYNNVIATKGLLKDTSVLTTL